jgi:NAD(P)-dependent dehydrogenase (short-subunit alcohol dehydrogenase family)
MSATFGDRWVLVSGASSGLGRAISAELVAQGARVVLLGRDAQKLAQTAQLSGAPQQCEVLVLDLLDLGGIQAAIKGLAQRIGAVYGLCHCAGVLQLLPLGASKPERVQRMMAINFFAGLELARAVVDRGVMDPMGGSVLWLASVGAQVGVPGQVAYSASKGAVLAAMRTLAIELAPRQIRVNALSPGWVQTQMTRAMATQMTPEQLARTEAMHPLGLGEPGDVARAAVFMLHPQNRWITGTDFVIDGGFSAQ